MSREHSRFKNLCLLSVTALSLFACLTQAYMIPVTKASPYAGLAKPMEFYFHNLDTPVRVAGLETKYVMNTTRWFRFRTQSEAYANSFYKPVGLPKIMVVFYLYPDFAGPVKIDGLWQVFVWVNGSAYKPVGFTLQFKEISSGGRTLWDSGQVSPTVTSSVGAYIDVPIYNYNLSAPLNHTFSADATLLIAVEVNTGSSADTRIWYDSPFYPSKAILPARDYARPTNVETYAHDNRKTDLFYNNWSQKQRIVIVRANVIDPFGGYDIHYVNITILDPANRPVLSNVNMARMSDGQWLIHFSHMFEANWTYSSTAQLGNYTVKVSVIDNNGYYHYLGSGSFTPFIEENTHTFSIGPIVYYDPAIRIVDDYGAPLPNADVFITWPNGTRDVLPRYTSTNGFINMTHVLPANYSFIVLWKDIVVKQTTIYINTNGPYAIRAEVYRLTVSVLGNNRVAVQGAYVIIYARTEVGYGLDATNATGYAVFKLPKGTYNIEARYSGEYWLKVVIARATEQGVPVNTSTSRTLVLAEFPPPIWSTTGFLLIVLIAILASLAIGIFLLNRRKRP